MTKTRTAEPRDLDSLILMFRELCFSLESKGYELLNPDLKERDNGISAFIVAKMTQEGNAVFVTEDEHGTANGFVIGWITYFPSIFQHQKVGEVQFMWPLSFEKSPYLSKAFDDWAKKQGATGGSNYAVPSHEASCKVFERAGRQLTNFRYFIPYGEDIDHGKEKLHG